MTTHSHKRTTTLFSGFGLTAAPANHDFVLDATYADLVVNIRNITGTTPSIQVEVVELVDPKLSLPYDAQTANFTLGRVVQGEYSNAKGLIVSDVDGGTTGTLELKNVQGRFRDNEPLKEIGASPGAAVANSATGGVWIYTEDGVYADSGALNTVAAHEVEMLVPLTGSPATAHLHPIVARRFRLRFTAGGVITNLDFDVDIKQLLN